MQSRGHEYRRLPVVGLQRANDDLVAVEALPIIGRNDDRRSEERERVGPAALRAGRDTQRDR